MSLHVGKIPDFTHHSEIAPDEVIAQPLRCAISYWRSIRKERRFPARADIRPRDIAAILRHVALVKYEDGEFTYRIVGDVIVRAFDIQMQNRKITDLAYEEPGFGAIVRPLLLRCVEQGEMIAVRGRTGRDLLKVNFTDYENVLLPLGPDDGKVDYVMTASSYRSRSQY